KRHWVEYSESWTASPMSYWVHIETQGDWANAAGHVPSLPKPVPGKGFARYFIENDGMAFQFSSLDELRACIEVLSKKNLPTSAQLASQRPGTVGPNSHWLSRLPAKTKSWKYREPAVAYLGRCLKEWCP
ncbi:MAG: hypothetical protein WBG86_14350, partial [Polyangiales bacterium]